MPALLSGWEIMECAIDVQGARLLQTASQQLLQLLQHSLHLKHQSVMTHMTSVIRKLFQLPTGQQQAAAAAGAGNGAGAAAAPQQQGEEQQQEQQQQEGQAGASAAEGAGAGNGAAAAAEAATAASGVGGGDGGSAPPVPSEAAGTQPGVGGGAAAGAAAEGAGAAGGAPAAPAASAPEQQQQQLPGAAAGGSNTDSAGGGGGSPGSVDLVKQVQNTVLNTVMHAIAQVQDQQVQLLVSRRGAGKGSHASIMWTGRLISTAPVGSHTRGWGLIPDLLCRFALRVLLCFVRICCITRGVLLH